MQTVTQELDAYHVTEAARAISAFVDDLSNWYARCRERYWAVRVRPTSPPRSTRCTNRIETPAACARRSCRL